MYPSLMSLPFLSPFVILRDTALWASFVSTHTQRAKEDLTEEQQSWANQLPDTYIRRSRSTEIHAMGRNGHFCLYVAHGHAFVRVRECSPLCSFRVLFVFSGFPLCSAPPEFWRLFTIYSGMRACSISFRLYLPTTTGYQFIHVHW